MPDKLKEFVRESLDKLVASMPPQEFLKRFPVEERLKSLSADERLKGLSAEEILRALPQETREALARQLKTNGHPSQA